MFCESNYHLKNSRSSFFIILDVIKLETRKEKDDFSAAQGLAVANCLIKD